MTPEQVAEHRKKLKKKKGGKDRWTKIGEGSTFIRVGKPWKKNGEFWKEVLFHGRWPNKVYCSQNDKDEETGKPRRCPACRRQKALKGDKSKSAKKLFGLLSQKTEGLWNVLVARVKKTESGLKVKGYEDNKFKILRLALKWHTGLLDVFADEDFRKKSILGIAHPKYGRLVRVNREGTGRDDTEYKFKAMDVSLLAPTKEQRLALFETLNDLDELVSGSSEEELDAFVRKMEKKAKKSSSDEDEDEDDDEPKKKKSRDEDEEEEEDKDEEESEDEDEDEPKSKKKKKKKSKDEDEDEDEDESEDEDEDKEEEEEDEEEEDTVPDDDDDEDEPKSKKKKKKKSKKSKGEDEDEEEEEADEGELDEVYEEMKSSLKGKKKKKKKEREEEDEDESEDEDEDEEEDDDED